MSQILVLNSGSSSIKYELFDMAGGDVLASGLIERIGEPESCLKEEHPSPPDGQAKKLIPIPDHGQGIQAINEVLSKNERFDGGDHLVGVGHRVVHGGELFSGPTLIDDAVTDSIRDLSSLAPLHNPANLLGIEVARSTFPSVPQVAVFDTAFHQSLPRHAYHYAIPRECYEQYRIRRYGFHGTSHGFVASEAAQYLNRSPDDLHLITLHLGNGGSATAIRRGKSIDTSMGLTPLEGLVMGTRSGDLDPAIVFHLGRSAGMDLDQLDQLLNKQSGLKGICGDNDMREVFERANGGDELAKLAVEVFTYRIKKYIGAYTAALGGLDALVFTAGIGENSPEIRQLSCDGLSHLGIDVDADRNMIRSDRIREIQSANSPVKVLVIPTNEELEIAQQTLAVVTTS